MNPVPTPPTTSSQNPLNSEEARSKGDNPIDSYYQFYCNYRQKTLLESKENEKNSLHFREQGAVKRNRTVTHH